jgi:hypothetical protein
MLLCITRGGPGDYPVARGVFRVHHRNGVWMRKRIVPYVAAAATVVAIGGFVTTASAAQEDENELDRRER